MSRGEVFEVRTLADAVALALAGGIEAGDVWAVIPSARCVVVVDDVPAAGDPFDRCEWVAGLIEAQGGTVPGVWWVLSLLDGHVCGIERGVVPSC